MSGHRFTTMRILVFLYYAFVSPFFFLVGGLVTSYRSFRDPKYPLCFFFWHLYIFECSF